MESRSSRGIQEPQVWAAADQLLAEGLRPTIERVRQKIGSGSPNTVSPMLERWFATLGKRLGHSTEVSLLGGAQDGTPPALLKIAKNLWEAAREEAARAQAQNAEAMRREFELRAAALDGQQEQLRQREAAFEQTRASLEGALVSSRQALESANVQKTEVARLHDGAQSEIRRLQESLTHAQALQEAQRVEHRAAATAREEAVKDIEARHTVREHRLLEDIDRERVRTRQAVADLAKEQKQRVRSEEEGALKLEAERASLRMVEKVVEQLRGELAAKSTALAQSETDARFSKQACEDFRIRLTAEERAHAATRGLLAGAIASRPKTPKARRAASDAPPTA